MLTLDRPSSIHAIKLPSATSIHIDEPEPDLEDELITLLGELEMLREGMVGARNARWTSQLLNLGEKLIDLVAAFTEKRCPFVVSRDREEATARTSEFHTAVAKLRVEMAESSSTAKSELATVGQSLSMLVEAMTGYFAVFTNRFPTSRAARPWVEAAATFLAEFRQLCRSPLGS